MEIKQFVWGVVDSNSWLITEGKHGLLIDAVDSQELYDELLKLDEITIILTHCHFDHIIGLNHIRELIPDVKVIATKLCSENLGNQFKNMSSTATVFMVFYSGRNDIEIEPFTCQPADKVFEEMYVFDWCGHQIELLSFHGHSMDSLIALVDKKYLFSGDTILPIPTVTRFPSGSTKRFWQEDIPRLKELDRELITYPGHKQAERLENMIAVNKKPERYRGQ
jgi:glyoxylase-like metal-dependent hydrolase (beta-lactamase superfamily II)